MKIGILNETGVQFIYAIYLQRIPTMSVCFSYFSKSEYNHRYYYMIRKQMLQCSGKLRWQCILQMMETILLSLSCTFTLYIKIHAADYWWAQRNSKKDNERSRISYLTLPFKYHQIAQWLGTNFQNISVCNCTRHY